MVKAALRGTFSRDELLDFNRFRRLVSLGRTLTMHRTFNLLSSGYTTDDELDMPLLLLTFADFLYYGCFTLLNGHLTLLFQLINMVANLGKLRITHL